MMLPTMEPGAAADAVQAYQEVERVNETAIRVFYRPG
jgi:hypothetical protein